MGKNHIITNQKIQMKVTILSFKVLMITINYDSESR